MLSEELKRKSFYLVYYIYSCRKAIPNWGRLWIKLLNKIDELAREEDKKLMANEKLYLELLLMKYYEAERILREHISPLFRKDSKYLKSQFQKTDASKHIYSEIIRKRAFYMGVYFWSLDGALDILSVMLSFRIYKAPSLRNNFKLLKSELLPKSKLIKNEFIENNKLKGMAKEIADEINKFNIYDDINQYRNFFSHNADYLQFLWKGKSYFVMPKDRETYLGIERRIEIKKAIDKYHNLADLARLKYVIDQPMDKWAKNIFSEFRGFLTKIFQIIDSNTSLWFKQIKTRPRKIPVN